MSKLLDSFQRDTGARTSLCKLVTLCPQKYMVGYHFVEDSIFLRAEPTFEQFQKNTWSTGNMAILSYTNTTQYTEYTGSQE